MNNSWERVSNLKDAFSLMEMMVVLLIVAILAAATAPMVTKKMARNAGSGDSPWVFTGLGNDITYNMSGRNSKAIIGAMQFNSNNSGVNNPRLVLAGGDGLAFADSNGTFTSRIMLGATSIAINDRGVGDNSVAIGMGQTIDPKKTDIVAVGYGAIVGGQDGTAIGSSAHSSGSGVAIGKEATTRDGVVIGRNASAESGACIAIGEEARVIDSNLSVGAIAIGQTSRAYSSDSIAIGRGAVAGVEIIENKDYTQGKAIAIGHFARATENRSVAIGCNATATANNQIVLGTSSDTVYIPGNLIVEGNVFLAMGGSTSSLGEGASVPAGVFLRESERAHDIIRFGYADWASPNTMHSTSDSSSTYSLMGRTYTVARSDRRLKNVGEKYTAGLDELKKLEFFHYTFKKDEAKIPHVGVMAQDLQKVFPDAVKEGEDGYLQIRWEDMFYAVINAVKELDTKICEIVENLTSLSKKVDEQQQLIETQQTLIEELQKQNVDLEKRLMKLEKKKHVELAN